MKPDFEFYVKELEEFCKMFCKSSRSFNEANVYDQELMGHLVRELQLKAAAVSRDLEYQVEGD